jgi:conjugal transfer/type IV secretion protein DotA/TraY
MKRTIIALVLALAAIPVASPPAARAQAQPSGGISQGQWYTVSPNDLSYQMLQQVFGTNTVAAAANPATVASNGGTAPETALAAAFKYFNLGLLVVTSVLVIFGIASGIVHTAHSGEWFGREISTFWLPLRASFSFGALMPLVNGYSFIQMLVLFAALQGVGIANAMWSSASAWIINRGGQVSSIAVDTPQPANPALLADLAHKVFVNLACIQAYDAVASKPGSKPNMQFVQLPGSPGVYQTSDAANNMPPGSCGSYALSQPSGDNLTNIGASLGFDAAAAQQLKNAILNGQAQGLQAMIAALSPAAGHLAVPASNGTPPQPLPADTMTKAVAAYEQALSQALDSAVSKVQSPTDATTQSSAGWAAAGAWYWRLSNLDLAARQALDDVPVVQEPTMGDFPPAFQKDISTSMAYALRFANQNGAPLLVPSSWETRFKSTFESYASSAWSGLKSAAVHPEATAEAGVGAVESAYSSASWSAYDAATARLKQSLVTWGTTTLAGNGVDPLVALQGVGSTIVTASLVGGGLATILTGGVSLPITMALIVSGVMLAVYLPIVPLIIWTTGMIGWTLMCILSVAAAPMWATANALPEGEGWATERAMQGWQFILGLTCRPALMIVGLIAGMTLVRVAAWFEGQTMAAGLLATIGSATGMTGLAEAAAGLVVLAGLTTYLVHMSFTLIHRVPDEILRWLGHGGSFGEEQSHGAIHPVVVGWMGDIQSHAGRAGSVNPLGGGLIGAGKKLGGAGAALKQGRQDLELHGKETRGGGSAADRKTAGAAEGGVKTVGRSDGKPKGDGLL